MGQEWETAITKIKLGHFYGFLYKEIIKLDSKMSRDSE